ncbi:MAG: diguanylate cyclase, partial [Sulfurimonas sp.]|nr:diguanylate cyclase [Sulfurimonas sp.]
MKNKNTKSLSTKIVFSIILVFFLIIFVIFAVFEKINKEAFYNIEIEKANIIARTIEPLIAVNIYLNMQNKINQFSLQLLENPDILAVKVLKGHEVINEIKSIEYEQNILDSFVIKKLIFQPNTNKKIGTLIIVYSSKNYTELINKYTKLTASILLALGIIFLLFGIYIKKLLSPLLRIASLLKHYSPKKKIEFPFASKNDEIGLISSALNNMQNKIVEYSKKQQNINKYLEEKVNEKTLELRRQLYIDTLTELPNRFSLLNDIKNFDDGALLIINIDDFKEINDFFGHIAGDDILKMFSHRLSNIFKGKHNIELKRLYGDEFALFFMKKPPLNDFIKTAQKLIYDIEKMVFFHEYNEIGIRVTIGGAYQIDKILEKADIALKS